MKAGPRMELKSFEDVKRLYSTLGCNKLYFKILQKNDNSKQQVYFGSNFSVLNIFSKLKISPDLKNKKILKSPLSFSWITESLDLTNAPNAQIIFYPQYPEVRFSGFLKGCKESPSEIMVKRTAGRLFFFGIKNTGEVIGLALDTDHSVTTRLNEKFVELDDELFHEVKLKDEEAGRYELLKAFKKINKLGWIEARRLDGKGVIKPCKGTNCGGYTLEALLGVRNNGISEPDFLGWEVKQFNCTNFEKPTGSAITLFTPEPNSGTYRTDGLVKFIEEFGYPDKSGKVGRLNFSSPHKFGIKNSNTNLTLELEGYDFKKNKIIDVKGGLVLLTPRGRIAAKWNYANMMEHWNKKHNQAVYIPSMCKTENDKIYYRYGNVIMTGEGTDFLLFLKACMTSDIYYDPGIKLENGKTKARSQFRIRFKSLSLLYHNWESRSI